jgi:hypothetical protein
MPVPFYSVPPFFDYRAAGEIFMDGKPPDHVLMTDSARRETVEND